MRTFIRHPSDIPIEVVPEGIFGNKEEYLSNVSVGGLAFRSAVPLEENSTIIVRIPLVRPVFEARGRVIWCREEDSHYDVGVEFVETKDGFRVRMVEQICHIEHYKNEIRQKEGRVLSGREAAMEWIHKYAGSFQNESLVEEVKKK
ncbi:MAG: PilZ domain-containing protein [Endomicrobiales bacterium]